MSDRISNLPDDLLHHILSRLPITSQVSTGLLSRRWRGLWSTNPVLALSRESFNDVAPLFLDPVRFYRIVHRLLFLWQAPQIKEFRLDVPHLLVGGGLNRRASSRGPSPADYWLSVLPRISHVAVLSIDLCLLKALVKGYLGQPVVFRDMKELHLNGMWLTDNLLDALHAFLGIRPSIEKLCLKLEDIEHPQSAEDCSESVDVSSMEYHKHFGLIYETKVGLCFKRLKCHALAKLRIVSFVGFTGTRNQMRLVKFLLESAANLESLHLFCGRELPDGDAILDEFSLCPRASSNAFILMSETE